MIVLSRLDPQTWGTANVRVFESARMCFNATFNWVSLLHSSSSSFSSEAIISDGSATTLNVLQNGHRMRNLSWPWPLQSQKQTSFIQQCAQRLFCVIVIVCGLVDRDERIERTLHSQHSRNQVFCVWMYVVCRFHIVNTDYTYLTCKHMTRFRMIFYFFLFLLGRRRFLRRFSTSSVRAYVWVLNSLRWSNVNITLILPFHLIYNYDETWDIVSRMNWETEEI